MLPTSVDTPTGYVSIAVSGAKTPNYRNLAANGNFIPPLGYSLKLDIGDTKLVSIWGSDQYWGTNNSWSYMYTWGRWSIREWYNPFDESDVTSALTRFNNNMLLKIKGQSLPILMALKERKETASLITKFLDKTVQAASYVRHPKKFFKIFRGRNPTARESRRLNNSLKRLLKREALHRRSPTFHRAVTISDAYLEYRFAWRPLLSDISDMYNGAAEAMKKATCKSARKGISFVSKFNRDLPTFFNRGTPGGTLHSDVSIRGHQKIFYSIDDATLALYSNSQSLMATLWDSVPYSFIVDGLVNISKYLECSNATLGLKFNSGYKSVIMKADTTLQPNRIFWNGSCKCRFDQLPSTRTQLSFNRQILTGFPVPKLEFPYEDYLTTQHIADLGALAIQKLKRVF